MNATTSSLTSALAEDVKKRASATKAAAMASIAARIGSNPTD
jgi:hypothetical protein